MRALPLLTCGFLLALAAPALAHDNGEGLAGETTGRLASRRGAMKNGHAGTQNHRVAPGEFADRFRAAFGRAI